MVFVCPRCKGPLHHEPLAYKCEKCAKLFPVVCGIPDFRLEPDPYIGMYADREKGKMLAQAAESRSFEELLRFYYSVTPEDPPDLAKYWIARALAAVEIASSTLDSYRLGGDHLLDLGCSTGAMLAAAAGRFRSLTGIDVAFRWLVIAQARLRELGVEADLVCANAEYLPFPEASFDAATAVDLLEHLTNPQLAVSEARRVSRPDAVSLFLSNNRYAPLPDPQVHMWGVGFLPRRWQAPYVAFRRKDLHRYHVAMRSGPEVLRLCRSAGYSSAQTEAAALHAPHLRGAALQHALAIYNAARDKPVIGEFLKWVAPKLAVRARR